MYERLNRHGLSKHTRSAHSQLHTLTIKIIIIRNDKEEIWRQTRPRNNQNTMFKTILITKKKSLNIEASCNNELMMLQFCVSLNGIIA